jgi:hypothetical protein
VEIASTSNEFGDSTPSGPAAPAPPLPLRGWVAGDAPRDCTQVPTEPARVESIPDGLCIPDRQRGGPPGAAAAAVWRPNWAAWFVIVASALMWWGIIALAHWAF